MNNAIAIDFGTSRTKVAYLDPRSQKPQLMRHGHRNEPFMPSLFYVFRDNERILWGHDAEEMLQEDPAGIVDVLKRKLQERYVYANRRKTSPQQLMTLLFSAIREQIAREVVAFQSVQPKNVFLTIPVLYGPAIENLLKEAATNAGFEKAELLPEPVAAARAWLAETGETSREVVVLDCGGGTVDWAYLQWDGNEYHIVPECPPGGDIHIGGHDVDRELLNYMKSINEDKHDEIEQKHVFYLQEMRLVKERFCRGLPLRSLKIGNSLINMDEREVRLILEERFIKHIIENLKSYLTKVKEVSKGESPVILLAGGSARIMGLKEAVESKCGCRTMWWENSEYATVLGAVPITQTKTQPIVFHTEIHSCESVAQQEMQKNSLPKTSIKSAKKDELQKIIQPKKQGTEFRLINRWRGHYYKGLTLSSEPHAVKALAFSPDSILLASSGGAKDKSIRIWEVHQAEKHNEPKELLTLKGHKGSVNSCTFSPDGKIIASGSADATVKLWDVKSGKETCTLRGHNSSVKSCVFSPDGRLLMSVSEEGPIHLWDTTNNRILRTIDKHKVKCIAFSPNGQLLACGGDYINRDNIFLWKVSDVLKIPCASPTISFPRMGTSGTYSICFSPDSKLLISSGDTSVGINLWDVDTGEHLGTIEHKTDQFFGEKIHSVVFLFEGTYIASGSVNYIIIRDVVNDKRQIIKRNCSKSIAFSPNGYWLADGCEDGYVSIFKRQI